MFLGICMGYVQDAFTESILTNNSVDLRLRISVVRVREQKMQPNLEAV
jgi:hypothetical protein